MIEKLPEPDSSWAMFLDFDGTLAEIAPTPDGVAVSSDLPGLLGRLCQALGGALVIVSGRPLAEIDRYLHPLRLPAAGLHGWQRRPAGGRISTVPPAPGLAAIRDSLAAFAAAHPPVRLEDKGVGVALHYRAAPEQAAACRAATAEAVSGDAAFEVLDGKMVVEVKPVGRDKGRAIETFLAEPPCAGRTPLFAGDDRTDEDGFAAVNRLGGISIRVGANSETRARFRIDTVDAFHGWLAAVAAALDGGGGA